MKYFKRTVFSIGIVLLVGCFIYSKNKINDQSQSFSKLIGVAVKNLAKKPFHASDRKPAENIELSPLGEQAMEALGHIYAGEFNPEEAAIKIETFFRSGKSLNELTSCDLILMSGADYSFYGGQMLFLHLSELTYRAHEIWMTKFCEKSGNCSNIFNEAADGVRPEDLEWISLLVRTRNYEDLLKLPDDMRPIYYFKALVYAG